MSARNNNYNAYNDDNKWDKLEEKIPILLDYNLETLSALKVHLIH